MPGNGGKPSRHKCRASTSPRGWHAAHLNKSFLDDAEPHSYSVGVSDSVAVNFSPRRIPSPPVAVHVTEAIPMDAGETEQQKKIRELQAIIAKGLKGINECRYKTDCEFACACPGIC
jgi:hypothetical protein